MAEKRDQKGIRTEIERGHFVRAVLLAEQMGSPEEEVRQLRFKALGQMSAVYRNALGAKRLALQYGFSKEEVRKVFEDFADEMKKEGKTKHLEPCYDYRTGKHLSFEEWGHHYLKIWDRLPV